MHRADVSLALTGTSTAEPAVVIDGLDEWMELGSVPPHLDRDPRVRGLLGPHTPAPAGDVGNGETDWLVDMTGDVRLERVGFG